MPSRGLAFTAVAAFLLAGCSAQPDGVPTEADAVALPPSALEAELLPPQGTNATGGVAGDGVLAPDTFLLAGVGSPEGSLTGFRWIVPEGALVPYESFDDWSFLYLEVLPILPSDQAVVIEEWDLLVFEVGREASLVTAVLNPTLKYTGRPEILLGSGTQSPSFMPFYLSFLSAGQGIEEGDELGFVLAAKSQGPAEVGLLVRVADSRPTFDSLPEDADDFRGIVNLPPSGTGQGVQTALYYDYNSLFVFGGVMQSAAAIAEERLPVELHTGVSARDMTISASYPDAGWTYAEGQYWGSDMQGIWDADADLHGLVLDVGGVAAYHSHASPATLVELIAFGLPIYMAVQEGAGASSSAFTVLVTNVDEFEFLRFTQIDLGADLRTLLGAPGASYTADFAGLVGDPIPPSTILREDGLVVSSASSVTLQFPSVRG